MAYDIANLQVRVIYRLLLNDLYTAVVTVAILGTPCYTGNSLKKFSKNI